MQENNIREALSKPIDLLTRPKRDWAGIITLWNIGYIAKPVGVSEEILEECCVAFNTHRGKVEWEEEAVKKVLETNNYGEVA